MSGKMMLRAMGIFILLLGLSGCTRIFNGGFGAASSVKDPRSALQSSVMSSNPMIRANETALIGIGCARANDPQAEQNAAMRAITNGLNRLGATAPEVTAAVPRLLNTGLARRLTTITDRYIKGQRCLTIQGAVDQKTLTAFLRDQSQLSARPALPTPQPQPQDRGFQNQAFPAIECNLLDDQNLAGITESRRAWITRRQEQIRRVAGQLARYQPMLAHMPINFVVGRVAELEEGGFKGDPDLIFNAFVTKDAHGRDIMFVFSGLFRYVETDAELAAVIGHEITHTVKGHLATKAARNGAVGFFGALGDLAVTLGSCLGTQGEICIGQNNIGTYTAMAIGRKFDRDQEREADQGGLELMCRAGFDATTASRLWERVARGEHDSFSLLNDHPTSSEREENLRLLANQCMNTVPRH